MIFFVGEKRFECPLCSVVCSDGFSLQEHVELHLDDRAAVNSAGGHIFIPPCLLYCTFLNPFYVSVWSDAHSAYTFLSLWFTCVATERLGSDLKLARQLQQEEEQRRRQKEAWQEREEFKKLQVWILVKHTVKLYSLSIFFFFGKWPWNKQDNALWVFIIREARAAWHAAEIMNYLLGINPYLSAGWSLLDFAYCWELSIGSVHKFSNTHPVSTAVSTQVSTFLSILVRATQH